MIIFIWWFLTKNIFSFFKWIENPRCPPPHENHWSFKRQFHNQNAHCFSCAKFNQKSDSYHYRWKFSRTQWESKITHFIYPIVHINCHWITSWWVLSDIRKVTFEDTKWVIISCKSDRPCNCQKKKDQTEKQWYTTQKTKDWVQYKPH